MNIHMMFCLFPIHNYAVTIVGTNLFGHGGNITSVMFGDVPAVIDYSLSNNTRIEVRVQANDNTVDTAVPIRIVADTSALVVSSSPIWTFLVQGEISSNQPLQGQVGTVIVITGTNLLGGGNLITEIFLDGVSASITSSSSTSVTVVMGDLLTQRAGFFSGEVYIMSDTGAVVSGGTYTHQASGTITSFSPTQGRRGTIITIQGSNVLGFGTAISGVQIAGVLGTVVSFSSTTVVAAAGMGARNQTGPIVLQIDTGAIIVSTTNFIFDEPGVVSSVTPTQGAEGTGVSVSGSGLIPNNVLLTSVTVGGVPVSRVVTASNQEVSIIVGPAPFNNSDRAMILINASDGSFVGGIFFSFITLTISLNGLSQGQEGTAIEINLPNTAQFEPNSNLRATVDNLAASITTINVAERRIIVSVPRARRLGTFTADVAVEGSNGVIARLRDGFMYLAEGLICTVDPVTGQTGTMITLQGENLLGGGSSIASASVVGQPAVVIQFSDVMVVLQLMQSRLEGMDSYPLQGDIILTADTGAVVRRLNTFSLVEPGSITQVSPSVGQNGTTVDIIGTNLLQGNLNVISVTLAGVPAVLMGIPTHTLVSVQATPSPATQVLSVVITLSSGASISSGGVATFQYLTPGRINTVSPNSGAVGTRLTISGSNLLQGGSTARMVLLGGFPAIIDGTPSTTSIDVIAQVGMPGLSGDVVIVSDTGSTLTGATSVFIYEAVGTITRVSPDIGQQGFEVTITGESLLGLAVTRFSTCLLAGVPAAIVVGRFNSTSVVCRAGANPFSRMNISGPVELATETGVMLNSGPNIMFTYYAAYIGSISPMWGNNGTEVTIRGLNLFNSPNGSFLLTRVLFGSVEATVDSSSANEVRVRVGFSNVPTTNNDVRIESSSGSFLVLANSWNYTSPRAIRALEPRNGFPGDTITLYGDNLVPVGVSAVRVVIGQTEAFNIQLINASTIQFRVGIYQNSDFPQRDLPVQIVYPSGETTSSTTVLFQYNATIENVTSVSPRAGGGGSVVVISGANLPNSTDSIRAVTLANVPAVVLSAGASEIVVEAGVPPSGVRGQVSIETITGRVLGLAGEVWEYYPSITNSDVSPVTGQNGTTVTIDLSRITNLPSVVGVSLTNVPAIQVTVTSSGMLTARAGQSTDTPIGDVTIDLAGGIIVEISNAWSYQAPVSITNVSPSSGYFNTLVTIQGSEFQVNAVTVTAVYLAGIETTIEFQSNTMLRVRISQDNPSDSDLDGPISIITDSGSFYSSEREVNFTYIGVQIRSVSPQSGTRGTLVTLTGVGLLAGGANITSATLAGVPATVQSSNSTMVSFTAGTLASSSNLGSIEYMVDTGARVQMPRSWRYIEPGEITFVTPSAGAMGTTVSIGGNNLLGGGTRVTSVVLNSRETTNILESFENFVQVTAEGTAGPLQAGNIQVISDTQAITESVSPVQFEYLEPGTISSITPSQGQNGTFVTITGQRFDNGEGVARVFIAGVEAAIRNNQGSTITVEAGRPTDSGSFEGPVLVQSSINTTSISAQNFTYLTEGIIFSVVPRQGRNGTVVSIEGENLLGGGAALESVILAGESADIINQTAGVASTVFVRAPLGFNTSNTGDVILVSDTNAHVRRVDGWTYVQRGTVSSVTPNQGQYGTHVIISGQNLLSGGCGIGTARFSDVTFEVVSVTDTTVMAIVGEPENPIEFTSESISITADLGGVLYVAYNWSFLNQSAIMNLNPPSGLSQEMVTINGTNLLGGGTVISSVRVAGIVGTVVMSSNNEVVIMTGTNELGALRRGDLILESDTGALTVATWTYEEECPVGMFGMADSCAPCSDQCQRCDGPTELNCTLCDNFNIYLDENSLFCVEKCPSVSTLDNVCVNACETNQYEQIDTLQNLTFCYNCSDLCDPNLGCSGPSPSQCPGCLFFRDANQTCVENCSSDSFFANGTRDCIPCHPQCSGGCYGPSEFECNGCANLRVNPNTFRIDTSPLFNDVCRETCPSLFFLDPLSNSDFCQSCDSSCSIGCNGPTPFDCIECRNVSFVYPNGTRKCLNFCSPNHYSDERNICMPCSDLCLPGEGCTGANPSDCNVCSLAHAPDLSCVRECIDSTYFIRNATRTCERCADACGSGGCTEAGPQNCIRQGSFAAGPGTTAFVIIVVFILIAVIVVLVTVVVLLYRRRGSSIKYRLPKIFSIGKESRKTSEEMARYTKSSQVQDIPLASIEEKKTMANPLFLEEGADACYPDEDDVLYMDAENEKSLLPNKNNVVSTSQDLYTDMDYPPSRSVTASQDMLYTDMEPGLIPARPPKPTELASKEPVAPPKDLGPEKDDIPPIPEKTQKPPPPPPEVEASSGELYTDMQGGITEVFINPVADDVYDDVLAPSPPPTLSPMETLTYKQDEKLLGPDTTYEDTESALASMEQFRKSFGAGSKNTTNYVPQEPSKKPIGKQQSAPALPSQPIPKKRPSSTSTTPLPPTPLQKSLSSTSFPTSISPTSTLTRPGSIISDRGGIPEEESLYDDIAGVQPLVKQTPAPPAKQKGQQKPKTKKK